MPKSPGVTMRFPPQLLARLDEVADGRTRSEAVRGILAEALGVTGVQPYNPRFTDAQRAEILERAAAGQRGMEIAKDMRLSREGVRRVIAAAGLSAPRGVPPACSHPKSKLKVLPYATICECGRRVR